FHKVFREYYNFIVNDLSSFYLDVLKDRLYTYSKNSLDRRSGLFTVYLLLDDMLKQIAPILPFTAEQAYMHFKKPNKKKSIHMEVINGDFDLYLDEKIENDFELLLSIRGNSLMALEKMRNSGEIGKSVEADIILNPLNDETKELLEEYKEILNQIFIVSNVRINKETGEEFQDRKLSYALKAEKAKGEKCARCWLYLDTVGKDAEHPQLCEKCAEAVKSEV
ncbi:TPA: isoleucine--tRNA ligase, partial [candidate division WOR-3 bacterium]|nr:isoleucine--tRNA ligase [candidate division WOR-3 bacterium]